MRNALVGFLLGAAVATACFKIVESLDDAQALKLRNWAADYDISLDPGVFSLPPPPNGK